MLEPYVPPFHIRYSREIKEASVAVAALLFCAVYKLNTGFRQLADRAVNPAVSGMAQVYGAGSTLLYRNTGIDFGLVAIPPDQDFLFGVRLATYINQRRAGPLLDIAADIRFPTDKRERAMLALLKFDSTADWIQPFLNELPKGGLLGMYDEQTPILDELILRIRAEGGVRQPLVRAYAEVVFSFMLQHPDQVLRLHASKWVSDVVAEDALFLLIPRFAKEREKPAQSALDSALYEIRAVSEPGTARELILPFYRSPSWPSLKRPLAVVLARLGYTPVLEYVNQQLALPNLTPQEVEGLKLAAARVPYPKELTVSSSQRAIALEHERQKQAAIREAVARRENLLELERSRQAMLNQSQSEKTDTERAAREAAEADAALAAANARKQAEDEAAATAASARKAAEQEAALARERKAAQTREASRAAKQAAEAKAAAIAAKKAADAEAAAVAARKAADTRAAAQQKASEAKASALAAKKAAEAEAAATAARKAAEAKEQARVARQAAEEKAAAIAEKKAAADAAAAAAARKKADAEAAAAAESARKKAAAESAAAAARAAAEAARKAIPAKPPAAFPLGVKTEAPEKKTEQPQQVVSLPPPQETLPPPLESVVPKSKSLMNYVDLVVQVKKEDAPLYQNPGDTPTGTKLPAGAKGRADFEVLIGEDKWYQVKSKKGTGWVNGKYVSIFNLSPGSEAPVASAPAQPSSIEGGRKESTYFETSVDNAAMYEKPSESAKKTGKLVEATPYLAVRSEKVGPDRWFLLQIRAGETAWARGLDLQLADVQQPNVLEIPTQELSQRGKTSAFKAEWISPAVKGVGVYSRPSIVAKMVKQINPSDVFKVVEAQSASGYEWYRIELSDKLDGWVQTMDVRLTKKPK